MSGRLSGSGVGDLIVDRDRALGWASAALRGPGVHLLVAEQGFGASVVVEHCRRVVPGLGVGRCHTGVLVPPMSPFIEAFDLPWPRLADPMGFVPSVDEHGDPERSPAWSESPEMLLARLQVADADRPFVVIDGQEALPAAVEVLVQMARSVHEGRSSRSVVVVAQPWRGRGHRVDWFEALVPYLASRFDLAAADPGEAWAWFAEATSGRGLPPWLGNAEALWAMTRGVPLFVGLAADTIVSGESAGSPGPSPATVFDLVARYEAMGDDARRLAAVLALADLTPVPIGVGERSRLSELVGGVDVDRALDELVGVGIALVGVDGGVRFTDPSWADAVLATIGPTERRALQLSLVEQAIAAGASPASVVVHLAELGWVVDEVAERLEDAVLAASGAPPQSRLEWLDLIELERPLVVSQGKLAQGGAVPTPGPAEPGSGPGSSQHASRAAARFGARLECFARLERPSVGARTALRVDGSLRPVEADPIRRSRRAMAYGRLVEGDHDRAIVELLDLREEIGRGPVWPVLTADLATVYLMAGRFVLCERSAADAWADMRAVPAVRAAAGAVLSTVRLVRGDIASASAVCDEVSTMLDLLDRPPVSPLPVHLLVAMVRFSTDRHAEALRLLEEGVAVDERAGATWGAVGYRALAARVWLRQGRVALAELTALRAAEAPRVEDGFRTEGWWAGVLGWIEWLRGGDPTASLEMAAEGSVGTVRVGSEVVALVRALSLESSGDPAGAVDVLVAMFGGTLGLGAVSALSEALPVAARLAVLADDQRLRQAVVQVLDVRSSGAVEVASRRAEQWAAQAWLSSDVARMRAAFERADGAPSALLAAELASDGELLARRVGDAAAQRWFADEAHARWEAIGMVDVAARRAQRPTVYG